jgi:sarcosine oxidase/L-pipecolate oxidase
MSQPSVLIIGGGAFGTSTAYHLSHRGYSNVTVLDRFAAPSKDAAATDLNKIIRHDYPNPLYTRLGREAMTVWKDQDSIFRGMFRGTGWIMAAHEMTKNFLKAAYETATKGDKESAQWMSIAETKEKWPEFTGSFDGWLNLWSPQAGWVRRNQNSSIRKLLNGFNHRFPPGKPSFGSLKQLSPMELDMFREMRDLSSGFFTTKMALALVH